MKNVEIVNPKVKSDSNTRQYQQIYLHRRRIRLEGPIKDVRASKEESPERTLTENSPD